ncbi:MAG: FKBP-type peptidyl-prolyl cis-trans isomerase [Xanthomonadaceae bacterium]|nr:FKBP-type peptidyl-prolyl cis-trans isomerase [Xanthomonadaceae bacterium]
MMGSAVAQDRTALTTDKEKFSYAVGMDVANSFQAVAQDIDVATMEQAISRVFEGGEPIQTMEEAMATDQALQAVAAARAGQQVPGAAPQPPSKEQVGLLLGERMVGSSLLPLKDQIDVAVMMQAVRAGFAGQPLLMTREEATELLQSFMAKAQQENARKLQELATTNQREGEAFLQRNRSQTGVVTTNSGLQYMVLRQGNGTKPGPTSKVRVNYEGKLLDGTVFDSSYQRGQPVEFALNQVIPGWGEGVQLMSTGAKYRFWIPSALGYGPNGIPSGPIGPNATLTFDVELLDIVSR